MRLIIGAKSAGGVRSAHGKLAITATFLATGSLAQAADCGQYAAVAVAQSQEYKNLGCSGGNPDWWRVDPAYHRNWCVSLPAGSAEPARGTASREAVLQQCRQSRRLPRAQRPRPPAGGSAQRVQRPTVFQGTVCDLWSVTLVQGRTTYDGTWTRGAGFFYTASWRARGTNNRFQRPVYPLNANLSFWSEDTASNSIFYYYNDRGRYDSRVGWIGGQWEFEAADGKLLDRGAWSAQCLDR